MSNQAVQPGLFDDAHIQSGFKTHPKKTDVNGLNFPDLSMVRLDRLGIELHYANPKMIEKFRKLADGMQNKIDKMKEPMFAGQNMTHRRMSMIEAKKKDVEALEMLQGTLRNLAQAHEDKTIPETLSWMKTKKAVELMLKVSKYDWKWDQLRDTRQDLIKLCCVDGTSIEQAKIDMAQYIGKATEPTKAEKIEAAMQKIQAGYKIPGYVRTPPRTAEIVLHELPINLGDRIIDPCAGDGAILDELVKLGCVEPDQLYASEINHALREVLRLKGHNVIGEDLYDLKAVAQQIGYFDGIATNFPFENSQDIEMAMWCADNLLQTGGWMVALLSPTVTTKQNKLNKQFVEWVNEYGWYEILPSGSFDKPYGGIGATMIVISKQ